jgi:diacylglycerol kinase family enzyme
MTVQGDGEVIGETPVEIQVVPKAVRVLVPKI